jgi:hypothetical protein
LSTSPRREDPVFQGEGSPVALTTTDRLLEHLGLAGATGAEQEAGVAEWLANHEPCESLRWDLREDGFTLPGTAPAPDGDAMGTERFVIPDPRLRTALERSGYLPGPPAASPG